MIRSMVTDNLQVPTTQQGFTRKTPPDKPDHVRQKHNIAQKLTTAGDGIQEQQAASLSNRTITGLSPHYTSSPETYWEAAHMDNTPRRYCCASYANVSGTAEPKTVRIGNQQLMTLDASQAFVDWALEEYKNHIEFHNFRFLVDFLSKNSEIEYIVDIGCGFGAISLLMQNYLNELYPRIKVVPVDIKNAYANCDGTFCDDPQPINLIPAQEIAGANPATTLFTAIHAFTGLPSEEMQLCKEIAQGQTDFYLTTLIKNNPGCFVLITEDPLVSSPQRYIPPELVYTKHYHALAQSSTLEELEAAPWRQAKAAEMNAENADIYQLNQLLAKLPEQRDQYLSLTSKYTEDLQWKISLTPWQYTQDYIFNCALKRMTLNEKIKSFDSIKSEVVKHNLELSCWHVYRHDTDGSEASR
ncbi:hypothetical protein J7438_15910 [Thalassotalea sp. G20_0]|uniref:hypothetical protein n=1 Tax=Thalassotalea sp. G20_0 TaxID=2821093 RepID=UPI001ADAA23A|nr:hypothetical protein [Thalassotalea sp. G20_0]MBO9495563.1 hypothetical protein [Thalassotalea sp. G20_0]